MGHSIPGKDTKIMKNNAIGISTVLVNWGQSCEQKPVLALMKHTF